jgi:hypothetical protein
MCEECTNATNDISSSGQKQYGRIQNKKAVIVRWSMGLTNGMQESDG